MLTQYLQCALRQTIFGFALFAKGGILERTSKSRVSSSTTTKKYRNIGIFPSKI